MSDLSRFTDAQRNNYAIALAEVERGKKSSHWMWYIFPQITGLGSTETSKHYAIKNLKEAEDFLRDEILGKRLIAISEALLKLPGNDAFEIFGDPDYHKLKSSMTLFDAVPGSDLVFGEVLGKFYHGKRDQRTLGILGKQ